MNEGTKEGTKEGRNEGRKEGTTDGRNFSLLRSFAPFVLRCRTVTLLLCLERGGAWRLWCVVEVVVVEVVVVVVEVVVVEVAVAVATVVLGMCRGVALSQRRRDGSEVER